MKRAMRGRHHQIDDQPVAQRIRPSRSIQRDPSDAIPGAGAIDEEVLVGGHARFPSAGKGRRIMPRGTGRVTEA